MKHQRQDKTPLYEEVFWSRPERADQMAGVAIVGGNRDSIKAPLGTHHAATNAGGQKVRVYLPDILKKQLGDGPGLHYVDTNASGSLALSAKNELLTAAHNSVLVLTGDSGRSSETAQLLEEITLKTGEQLVVAAESLDLLLDKKEFWNRKHTTLVLNGGQFQRLVTNLKHPKAYNHDMPLISFTELLENIGNKIDANLVVLHAGQLWSYVAGTLTATKRTDLEGEILWANHIAGRIAVFLSYQNASTNELIVSALFNEQLLD